MSIVRLWKNEITFARKRIAEMRKRPTHLSVNEVGALLDLADTVFNQIASGEVSANMLAAFVILGELPEDT